MHLGASLGFLSLKLQAFSRPLSLNSSHIDVKCLKITSRNPREECTCTGFIANEQEMQMENDRLARKKERENEEKNALKVGINT